MNHSLFDACNIIFKTQTPKFYAVQQLDNQPHQRQNQKETFESFNFSQDEEET